MTNVWQGSKIAPDHDTVAFSTVAFSAFFVESYNNKEDMGDELA